MIAQSPAARRDGSRLFVLDGEGSERHKHFSDIESVLRPEDLLVFNETRVIAARLIGRLVGGGRAELLLLHPANSMRYDAAVLRWLALARPGRRLRVGDSILFGEEGRAVVRSASDDGVREVEFDLALPFEDFLERVGRMPLPPYIHNDSEEAQRRYQSVFARVPGSVAAPTASLHFTPEILERISARGIESTKIVLDVGLGTFRPMNVERIDDHQMHAERFEIPQRSAEAIANAKRGGRRIVAVGTTVIRALEGAAQRDGNVHAGESTTTCFISPGFEFKIVDAAITNFHLPRSSLLVLASAFVGRERLIAAYREAIVERYRFFSFGDAMFLERGGSLRPSAEEVRR